MGLKFKLAGVLEPFELRLLSSSYDVVGDIAVLRIPKTLEHRSKIMAEAVMQINKHVKTVLHQVSPVSGDLRLRKLEWIAGEKKTETVHREAGCIFKVDLEQCYFSPRLSHERMRIARIVKPGEVIVNMFAGVGCYSIIIAKHVKAEKVYSIDINPVAVQYMQENIKLNKLEGIVEPIEGDSEDIIKNRLLDIADRVLMPLPERAYEYLECANLALKSSGGWIHYYDFEHAGKDEDPIEKTKKRVSEKLLRLNIRFDIPSSRIVRAVGPRWYQIVLDINSKRVNPLTSFL